MRRIPIEMIVVLLLIGAAIGIAWSKGERMENQIAEHATRLAILEADYAKRKQVKACANFALGAASKCLEKLSFGLIKLG